jgi:hypothetical protein
MTKQLPPFELQGSRASLASLATEIVGYSASPPHNTAMPVWLKNRDGEVLLVAVEQRDLLPKFEVFTLSLASMEELKAQMQDWQPPQIPNDIPEPFRSVMATRPKKPTPPEIFEEWPFATWRTQVLQRAEYIIEDVTVIGAVGENPNAQSATRPNTVPSEAAASSDIAAGLLFSSIDGQRLLLGVDWMPFNMVVTEDNAEIDEYLEVCEALDMSAYLEQRFGSA